MAKVGASYTFVPTADIGYKGTVTVVRPLRPDEHDEEDTGPMYEVVTTHGRKLHAFEDELTPEDSLFMEWYSRS